MTIKERIRGFKNLTIQQIAAIIISAGIVIGAATAVIKKVKYYIVGIDVAIQANENREELLNAFYVLNGVVSSNMYKADTLGDVYYIVKGGKKLDVIIRTTLSDDFYVFVPHEGFGEMPYILGYNKGRTHYWFVDFEGRYTPIKRKY